MGESLMAKKRNRRDILYEYYYSYKAKSDDLDEVFLKWLLNEDNTKEIELLIYELWEREQRELPDEQIQKLFDKTLASIKSDKEKHSKVSGHIAPSIKRRTLRRVVSIVAVIVPLFAILGAIYIYMHSSQAHHYTEKIVIETIKGEKAEKLLSDSSKVWLNSSSKIEYVCDENKTRNVKLIGEAYFDVANVNEMSFIVETSFLKVTVLGTKFNIKAYPEGNYTVVRLDQGEVTIDIPKREQFTLKPNQLFILDNGSLIAEIKEYDEIGDIAKDWREGAIVCYKMTVKDMLYEIGRNLDYQVFIDDKVEFSNKEYIATFSSSDSIESVLEMIKYMEGEFSYQVEGDNIYILQ